MSLRPIDDQLIKYLTDAHSIEEQAIAQMRAAPDLAGDPGLADAFRAHLAESERHERLVRERLDAHGASPSKLKDAVMAVGGKGFVLFARSQPDTTGKLSAHALSYEHLEYASYELLLRVARRAGDEETAAVAEQIRDEEAAMAQRIEDRTDAAVEASLREQDPDDLAKQLLKYLSDAHAIENQAIQLLSKGEQIAGDPILAQLYDEHLGETREHEKLIDTLLESHGARATRSRTRRCASARSTGAGSSPPSPTRRASSPRSRTRSSSSRSAATSSCSGWRSGRTTPTWCARSRRSSSRSARRRARSRRSGIARSRRRC